jgi:Zn-finger nucleic acid-binding protein
MTERQGVEIDYCPQCRGVWLDRGELDKIIERGTQQTYSAPSALSTQGSAGGYAPERQPYTADYSDRVRPADQYGSDYRGGYGGDYRRDDDDDYYYDKDGRRKRKRGSFLSEIFDFD